MSNYNRIAYYYDTLAKLVFGKSQINAQKDQLVYIQPNSKILIVGGGTGWILEEIAKIFPGGLVIDYVESSNKMIGIAKKRNIGRNTLNFLSSSIENFRPTKVYDVVITAFLFDNFVQPQADVNFLIVHNYLKENGYWLFSDFDVERKRYVNWRNVLMKAMYLFFKVVADVKPKGLIEIKPLFRFYNYEVVFEKWYYKKVIRAAVYRKLV
ncbi:ubiquinone/menaquinone biosynthesis C-methylase UbiE [Pedobacter sp. UYP30]|uniref:class I SAM-dependent methyltransferase n=1 Tax=Pedobacter sp. UYP30 TaxID=1756400 RepID=UPI0033925142